MLPPDLSQRECTHLSHLSIFFPSGSMGAHTRMADTGVVYFYSDLVRSRCFYLNVFNGEVFAGFPRYGGLETVNHCSSCLR